MTTAGLGVRAALLGIDKLEAKKRSYMTRLSDPLFFDKGYAPVREQRKSKQQALLSNFGFNFSTLPPPSKGVTWQDIEEFERVNDFRLRISVWQWMKVEQALLSNFGFNFSTLPPPSKGVT